MAIINSAVSILLLSFFSNNSLIPVCYLDFPGDSKYSYHDSYRKSRGTNFSTEFSISPRKSAYNNITDSYTAQFLNKDSMKSITIDIQLCDSKKFKQRVLANYKFIADRNILCHCHNTNGVKEFEVDSTMIYGFTAGDISENDLGDYVMFPTDKMAIYIRFTNGKIPEFTSIKNFITARNEFIHSYLLSVSVCKSR